MLNGKTPCAVRKSEWTKERVRVSYTIWKMRYLLAECCIKIGAMRRDSQVAIQVVVAVWLVTPLSPGENRSLVASAETLALSHDRVSPRSPPEWEGFDEISALIDCYRVFCGVKEIRQFVRVLGTILPAPRSGKG
jgi:hypothetical protein